MESIKISAVSSLAVYQLILKSGRDVSALWHHRITPVRHGCYMIN